jgi:hypothetical protein
MKLWLMVMPCLLLGACANPTVVNSVSASEQKELSCEQIKIEIEKAAMYQRDARKEDRFKLRYILIAPAVMSIYNMDKAEKAAKSRGEELQQLSVQKNCAR